MCCQDITCPITEPFTTATKTPFFDMLSFPSDPPHLSYVLSVLEQIIVEGYIVVYLHYTTPQNSLPGMSVFHKFYKMVDRR